MLLSGMSRRGAQGGQEGNWGQGSSLCLRHHTLASLPVLCFLPAPRAGMRAGGCAVLVRPQVLQKHRLGQGNSEEGGQCLCATSGSSGAFPLVLTGSVPPCLSFPPRLQWGCDLTWLPAWPPRFEFLLCACCAARKVLWESKYSSPRRLQPGCSLARRGAPGEGLRRCRGRTGSSSTPLCPASCPWGLCGDLSRRWQWGAAPHPDSPGMLCILPALQNRPPRPRGPPQPIRAGSPLLSPWPRCVLLRRGRSWAGVRGRGAARGAFLTYLPAPAEPVGCCPGDSVALRPSSSALRPGCTY